MDSRWVHRPYRGGVDLEVDYRGGVNLEVDYSSESVALAPSLET